MAKAMKRAKRWIGKRWKAVRDVSAPSPVVLPAEMVIKAEETEESRLAHLIRESDLFDFQWYLDRYPDVGAAEIDPALHYLLHGAREGRDPGPNFDTVAHLARFPELALSGENPLLHYECWIAEQIERVRAHPKFDARWYLDHYPDIAASGADPARHYLFHGAEEGRNPGPDFDTMAFVARMKGGADIFDNPLFALDRARDRELAELRSHPLFDGEWYLERYDDLKATGADAAEHFLDHGAREGRDPSLYFDTATYVARFPDVALSGENPLFHEARMRRETIDRIAAHPLFDREWYLAQYPDVAASGADAAEHYARYGAAEDRDPGPSFSTAAYRQQHAGALVTGENPLIHHANAEHEREGQIRAAVSCFEDSELFDAGWYRERYPDIAAAGNDPAWHYAAHGAAEGRDPGPAFCTSLYLEWNPDIQRAGVNPLAHYVEFGRAEGRALPVRFSDEDADLAAKLDVHRLFDAEWYERANPEATRYPSPAYHYLASGGERASDPGPDFNRAWYLRRYDDVAAGEVDPFVHYVLWGEAEGREYQPNPVHLSDFVWESRADRIRTALNGAASPTDAALTWSALPPLDVRQDSPIAKEFAVFDRLHKKAKARDVLPDSDLLSASIMDLPASCLTDGWFVNDGLLRVRVEVPEALQIQAFQMDGSELRRFATARIAAPGPAIVDLLPAKPLFPILIVYSTPSGETTGATILPFPSLFRGGLHHAEVVAQAGRGEHWATVVQYAKARTLDFLQLSPDSALLDTIVQADLDTHHRDWLVTFFGLRKAGKVKARLTRGGQGVVLNLPNGALPTIAGLVAARNDGVPGEGLADFVAADRVDNHPMFAFSAGAMATGDLRVLDIHGNLPWIEAAAGEQAEPARRAMTALVICRPRKTNFDPHDAGAVPGLPATGRITILLRGRSPLKLRRLVASLGLQTAFASCDLKMLSAESLPLPDVTGVGVIKTAEIGQGGEDLLILDEAVQFETQTAVEKLREIGQLARTASVGCTQLYGRAETPIVRVESAGLFVDPNGLEMAGSLLGAIADVVYPAAGNDGRCVFVPRSALQAIGNDLLDLPPGDFEQALSQRGVSAGLRHLTTTSVRVLVDTPRPERNSPPVAWHDPSSDLPHLHLL